MAHNKYIIKAYKSNMRRKKGSFYIVVGTNKGKVNGGYIEKLGTLNVNGDKKDGNMDMARLGFWLNNGALLSSRASWVLSYSFAANHIWG